MTWEAFIKQRDRIVLLLTADACKGSGPIGFERCPFLVVTEEWRGWHGVCRRFGVRVRGIEAVGLGVGLTSMHDCARCAACRKRFVRVVIEMKGLDALGCLGKRIT